MNKWSQVIALEQNDAGTRVMIVTHDGRIRGAAYERHRVITPQPGWVEYDPAEMWYKAKKVLAAGLDIHRSFPEEIAAVGITGQRATTVVWNRDTGEPYCNAIAEQDTRTDDLIDLLRRDGVEELVRARTGLPLRSSFSAVKLKWLLDNLPGLRREAEQGRVLFGTLDSWLLWHLTGVHATDYTSAVYTQLFNIQRCDWDQELLALFAIPRMMLPSVYPSSNARLFGHTRERTPFNGSVPVAAVLCEPQAVLFGLACFNPGDAGLVQGTSGSLLLNTGARLTPSSPAWATLAYALQPDPVCYALEMPFPGERPLRELVGDLAVQAGERLTVLRVAGDRAQADSWMQLAANVLGIPLVRPQAAETASLGAIYAAGLAVGFWENVEALSSIWKAEQVYAPRGGRQ
ncbi:MAG: FGGY family carbohydrate kinase [Anaerolineae bacterium]